MTTMDNHHHDKNARDDLGRLGKSTRGENERPQNGAL
jgi:hypothetical protein